MPLDIMRTARWGGIEYDCAKSEAVLGISYTPIDTAVHEAICDVRQRGAAGTGAAAKSD